MKKYVYVLLMMLGIVSMVGISSCSDDDDFPSASVVLTMTPVSQLEGVTYMSADQVPSLLSIDAKSLNGNNTGVDNVAFYWDGAFVFSPVNTGLPFSFENLPITLGRHYLTMYCILLQEDKSVVNMKSVFPIVVVQDETQLPPDAPALGEMTLTSVINPTAGE